MHNRCAVSHSITKVSTRQSAVFGNLCTSIYCEQKHLFRATALTTKLQWTFLIVPPSAGQTLLLQTLQVSDIELSDHLPQTSSRRSYTSKYGSCLTAVGGTSNSIGSTGVHHLRSIANELTSSTQTKYSVCNITTGNRRVTYLNVLFCF